MRAHTKGKDEMGKRFAIVIGVGEQSGRRGASSRSAARGAA
jgi:hypothetical protein